MDIKYSYESFLRASESERVALCQDLAAHLAKAVSTGDAFHASVYSVIAELRDTGHELQSFDESDDFQLWYRADTMPQRPGLTIRFDAKEVLADWMP